MTTPTSMRPSFGRHSQPSRRPAARWLATLWALGLAPLLGLWPPAALAYDTHLRRYPYLTDVVEGWATINWATDQSSATSVVRWGRAGAESCTAHTAVATSSTINVNQVLLYQWKAQLALKPDTEYCYRIYQGSAPEIDLLGSDRSPRFRTQLPAGSSKAFSFAVFGDWGEVDDNGNNPDQANLMRQIAASGARFAITTGDNGYPSGSQANYGDLVQKGQGLSGVFGPTFWAVAGASIPLFPAIGNHGLGSSTPNHPQILAFPQDRAVASSGGRYVKDSYCCLNGTSPASYASAWYAFDTGNARFYVLHAAWSETNIGQSDEYANDYDYHWAPGTPQYQWLVNDLATHPSKLKFAFLHYPLYSDNSTEGSDQFLQGGDRLEGLLSRSGVNIMFSGHAHSYQRNIKPHSDSLISYVTGGGGAKLAPVGGKGCSSVDAYALGWSYSANGGAGAGSACGAAPVPVAASQVFHFLLVRVNGTQVTVTPTDSRGRTFDVQVYEFARLPDTQPPSPPANLQAALTPTGAVALSWPAATDNVAVTSYVIMRNRSTVATLGADTRAYRDTAVTPGATYRYEVVATDQAGNRSAPSPAATVAIPATSTSLPIYLPVAYA
ncbi:MAG: metallophosphoesterase [Kouleothrix sp.]